VRNEKKSADSIRENIMITRSIRYSCFPAAAVAAILLSSFPAKSQEPIKVGTLFSATGGGAIISYSAQAAANFAADEMNKKGGIMGRKVELVPADDQSDPSMSSLEAKRLVADRKVDVILGPVGSVTTLAVVPVLSEYKVANFSIAQAQQLTPQAAPYHFTLVVNTDETAKLYIRFAVEHLKATRLAILVDKTAGQKALLESFKKAMKDFPSATVVAIQEFDTNGSDQLPQVLSLRDAKPDVILHSALSGHDAGVSLAALQDIGWNVPIVLSTSAANASQAVLAVTGPDGLKGKNIYAWDYKSLSYCEGDAPGSSSFAKFNEGMKAFAPEIAKKVSSTNALWIYDGFYFLKAAIEGTGSTEGPKIAKWLEANGNSLQGILGKPTASSENHFMYGADELAVIERIDTVRSDGLKKRAGC